MTKEGELRIIIIGDTSVGKTSLMKRFIDDTFSQKLLMTIGVEIFKKMIVINNKEYLIKIWDTCGQERLQSITYSYYRNVDGILLVFDRTQIESFENLSKWFKSIKNICPMGIPLVIVENKIDKQSEIDQEELNQFKLKIPQYPYFETSCLSGQNTKEPFKTLFKMIINQDKDDDDDNNNNKGNNFNLNKKEENNNQKKKKCCS